MKNIEPTKDWIDIKDQSFIFTFINEVPIFWMKLPEQDLRVEFEKVFKEADQHLITHYINKWDGDFARFWFNMDEKMKEQMFDHYMVQPNDETKELIRRFYLVAYNYSLEFLDEILQYKFTDKLTKCGIELFGNGLNWSKAFYLLTPAERLLYFKYLNTAEKL